MNPFMPHFTSECLKSINQNEIGWPTISKEDLIEEEINFVVQINLFGKLVLKMII